MTTLTPGAVARFTGRAGQLLTREGVMPWLLLLLIVLLIAGLPAWPYSAGWSYYPSGGLLLLIVVLLLVMVLTRGG